MNSSKFFVLLAAAILLLSASGAAAASRTVPGDVIVTFINPFSDVPVTEESLAQGSETQEPGAHAAYIDSVAKSLDAKVTSIYVPLSIAGGDIVALFHTDSKSENELWLDLRLRQDVKGASLNHVRRISTGRLGRFKK